MKENAKRRLWPIALSILGAFFALTVMGVLCLSTWESRLTLSPNQIRDISYALAYKVLGLGNPAVFLLILGMAVILAIQGFHYLQDARETDLYGSLPVKRQTLYGVVLTNGFLIFALPYTVFHVLTLLIGAVKGYVNGVSLLYAAESLVAVYVLFGVIYMTAVFATVLTGNWIVAALGTSVFYGICPFVALTADTYLSEFFITYYSWTEGSDGLPGWLLQLSPISAYVRLMDAVHLIEGPGMEPVLRFTPGAFLILGVLVLVSAALVLICRQLVMVRPGEACGRAMAFNKTRPWIKAMILLPAAFMSGLLFYEIGGNRLGWLFFGIIACLLIGHGVMEIIYESDFRAAFHGWRSLIVCFAVAGGLLILVLFDPFGYEGKHPAQSRVAEVAVSDEFLFSGLAHRLDNGDGFVWYDGGEWVLSHMHLEDSEALDALIRLGASYAADHHLEAILDGNSDVNYRYKEGEGDAPDRLYHDIQVQWTLKDGRTCNRRYCLDVMDAETREVLSALFAQEAFKAGVLPGLTLDAADVEWFSLNNYLDEAHVDIPAADAAALLAAYRSDVMAMSWEEATNEAPCVILHVGNCERGAGSNREDNTMASLPVYPSYTATAAWLAAHGLAATWRNGYDFDHMALEPVYGNIECQSVSVEGQEEIRQVLACAIPDELWEMCAGFVDPAREDAMIHVFASFGAHDDYSGEYLLDGDALSPELRDALLSLVEMGED
ncbi:MAG: hypothetical protein IJT34_07770 [Butyrivibrio sp.]|nr:hypothetical protein [Butyrivibrio sp.]